MKRPAPLAALFFGVWTLGSGAQEPAPPAGEGGLTLEKVLSLERKLRPKEPRIVAWLDARTWIERRKDEEAEPPRTVWSAVDAETGEAEVFVDSAELERALAAADGMDPETARRAVKRGFLLSEDRRTLLIEAANDLFSWRRGEAAAVRLTHDPETEVGADFSPDGRYVAFVKEGALRVVPSAGGAERVLVRAPGSDVLVGRLDWVYQEEIYGRGNWKGFFWSPDSKHIAYLELDESRVPSYTIVDHRVGDRSAHPRNVEVWRYPKAGDPNPGVSVGIVDVAGGAPRKVDLGRYAQEDILVVRVGWRPDAERLLLQVQNRVQTWLDLVAVDPNDGSAEVLFRDRTSVWIEPTDAPFFFPDSSRFLWLSERDGFRHLYLYAADGRLERRLTEGEFEIDDVLHLDAERGVVFVASDREDVRGRQLFRVSLEDGSMERISASGGTHRVRFGPDGTFYLDTWSSLEDPGWVAVFRRDGRLVRTLNEVDESILEPYDLPRPRFLRVAARDGFEMEAMFIEPRNVKGDRHPVLLYQYSGPHAPQVLDRYAFRSRVWHQWLASRGIGVFVVDNRSASGKGLRSMQGIWHRLGVQELQDLEDAVDRLVETTRADPDRIAIWGWSYGGYMTAYALTHSKKFCAGVAGAPVTDWRFYDTIYTERYMDTPQRNPEGYEESSVVAAAADLHGALLLIHGTIDENVHLQNTLELARALQQAGRPFDLMLYPGNRHGVADPKQRLHLYRTMTDWICRRLLPGGRGL